MGDLNSSPENSRFRRWFCDGLRTLQGKTLEWPVLLRHIIDEEFQRLRTSDQYYSGNIFRNRDENVENHRKRESQDEEILVYKHYAAVHENYHGVLTIGDDSIWLFSIEVPNQGKELSYRTKKRKADLIGLQEDGSLVVFECKGPVNRPDTPLYGILEGLDYLGCLLTPRNLSSLDDDLQEWILDQKEVRDNGRFYTRVPDWQSLRVDPKARHRVIVLAPKSYYEIHCEVRNDLPQNWWLLSDRFLPSVFSECTVGLDFAVVDFEKGKAEWFDLKSIAPSQEAQ